MVYRRFGFLQTRLLLEKQDTLRALEKRLDKLDKSETEGEDNEDNLCTRDGGEASTERINLMTAIGTTFREYGQLHQASSLTTANVMLSRTSAGCASHGSFEQAVIKRVCLCRNLHEQ